MVTSLASFLGTSEPAWEGLSTKAALISSNLAWIGSFYLQRNNLSCVCVQCVCLCVCLSGSAGMCVWLHVPWCMCGSQLPGISSLLLLLCGVWCWTQATRLCSQWPYSLSHLASQNFLFKSSLKHGVVAHAFDHTDHFPLSFTHV
jgi:hypothetical protein